MKLSVLVSAVLLWVHAAFPQGYVNFDNRANTTGTPGEFPGAVLAPIYNCDPANPGLLKDGNTSAGIPAGTQAYGGPLLYNDATHHYTVTLWAFNSANVTGIADFGANNLVLVGTTTMRTSTSGINAGRFASATSTVVFDVMPNSGDRATFQVRIWDDRGGTITTWQQFISGGANTAYGVSRFFTVPYPLGSSSLDAPNLEGLQSFQLFCVPEPSVMVLGLVALYVVFLRIRR
jgi:hypothetical protein